VKSGDFDNLKVFSLLGLAGAIEIVGSLLLLVGLFTRPAAFIMSGEMLVAYFMLHAPRGFFPILNRGELAVLFCFLFLFFAIAGSRSWSLDRYIRKTPDYLSKRASEENTIQAPLWTIRKGCPVPAVPVDNAPRIPSPWVDCMFCVRARRTSKHESSGFGS
jgi:hypothetical protein